MKYVINSNYGGFSVPEEVCKKLSKDEFDGDYDVRKSQTLIDWVKSHKDETDLTVVTIPDSATDWELDEYDGWEEVVATVNGKIIHIDCEDEEEED